MSIQERSDFLLPPHSPGNVHAWKKLQNHKNPIASAEGTWRCAPNRGIRSKLESGPPVYSKMGVPPRSHSLTFLRATLIIRPWHVPMRSDE